MHQLAGRHVQARCPEACLSLAAVNQWCSSAAVQRSHASCRRQRAPHTLRVSCPAVEQDTEMPSTSGRPHSDSELMQLLAQDQPGVLEALDVHKQQQDQPDQQEQLLKRIKLSGSLPLLCELVQSEALNFDHKLTSAALYRLSILCHAYFTQLQSAQLTSQEAQNAAWVKYVDPALKQLGQLLLQHMDTCDPYTVAISLWAYGHLQCGEEAVLAQLSLRGMQLLHDFNTIDCASALVGFARHTGPRTRSQREFVEQLMQHTHALLSHVDEWRPRDMISIIWALSQLGAAGPSRRPLLQGLVEMSLWRIQEFGVKELVITIYSLGRLRMRLPAQMVKLTNQIMGRMDELNPQDAANLVYACAKVQFKQPELLQALPRYMVGQLHRFKPQEISNLLYGYGQLHFSHPMLLEAVASTCAPRLPDFSTQDLCLTVWGYGAVGYSPMDTTLFEAACRVLLQRKERLVPLQIVMVIKGFSRAGYQPPAAFMQQMSQLAQAKLSQFSPLEYSQLLWGYSTAGYRDVQLFETVVAHAIHQLHTRTHLVTKTTCDTLLVACQGVGFWPQLLVDTAEMNGLYVKTAMQGEAAMPLVQSAVPAAADPTPAGAAGGEAAAAATAAADSGSPATDVALPTGSSSADLSAAVTDAFGAALQQQVDGSGQQQQQQQEVQPQQRQASRLDSFLQRPPPRRQQQQQQQPPSQAFKQQPQQQQPGQPQQQGRQQLDQQGLNHPLLRSQLLPPPALPRQQQQHNSLPAAAVGSLEHSNGNHSSHSSQHSNTHSTSSSSSSQDSSSGVAAAAIDSSTGLSDAAQLQQQQQQGGDAEDVLVHPVQQS